MPGLFTYLKDFSFISYSFIILFFVLSIQDWQKITFNFAHLNIAEDHEEFYSSVYCRGSNHTDRLCRFKNLCYNPVSDVFLFFHDVKSDIIGIPEDRFSPALVDFSSVFDHNTQYFNYVDLPSSIFTNFSSKIISGTAILFKRFNPENLMHVFHDDLIPAFATLKENFLLGNKNDAFFVFADGREVGPYGSLYEKFLDKQPLYLNMASRLLCFEKAIVGLHKHSLWYQYGFKQPQGPLKKNMNLIFSTLFQFRDYFKKRFSLNGKSDGNKTLLLTRGHNRKILNSNVLAKILDINTNLKTYTTSLEECSVTEVIEKIMSSKLVVGMHGSLLILSLFLPPYSHVIELFPYGINPNICTPYKTLAEIPGLELTYHSWENKIKENSFPHPEYPAEYGGILHLPIHKQEHIKNSVVKPFLCCYNPEWLYRIYQDTIVDIESFTNVIKNAFHISQRVFINEIIERRLYPSEVQNISCQLISGNHINISWDKPWNVNFMNVTTIEYELWYQDNDDGDIKAFIMHKTFFTVNKNILNIYVWIRCHVDGRIGPFNTDPLICQK